MPFFGLDSEAHCFANIEVECRTVAVVPYPDLVGVITIVKKKMLAQDNEWHAFQLKLS